MAMHYYADCHLLKTEKRRMQYLASYLLPQCAATTAVQNHVRGDDTSLFGHVAIVPSLYTFFSNQHFPLVSIRTNAPIKCFNQCPK